MGVTQLGGQKNGPKNGLQNKSGGTKKPGAEKKWG